MFNNLKNIFSKTHSNFILDYNNFKFSNDVCFSRQEDFTPFDLKNELLDRVKLDKNIFSIYWNVFKLKDKLILDSALIKSNIFVINPGFLGREFNKTFCYSVRYKDEFKPALFEVLSGEGCFIIESFDFNNLNSKIKFVKTVKISSGSQIFIPKGCLFTLINSSESQNLVCLALIGKNTRFYSNNCKKQNGATLFYTNCGFVRNKNVEPSYRLENFEGDYLIDEEARELFGQKDVYLDTLAFDKKKGLYREFINFPEKFNFLK